MVDGSYWKRPDHKHSETKKIINKLPAALRFLFHNVIGPDGGLNEPPARPAPRHNNLWGKCQWQKGGYNGWLFGKAHNFVWETFQ